MSEKTVSYKQLYTYGLTHTQVTALTQNLTECTDEGQTGYNLRQVIVSIRHYLASSHLHPAQAKIVNIILATLLQQLDNVVVAPFGLSREKQLSFHIQRILDSKSSFLQPQHHYAPTSVVLLRDSFPGAIPE